MGKSIKKSNVPKILFTIFFLGFGITYLFPFFFMLSSSFKNAADVFDYPFKLIPRPLVLTNYPELNRILMFCGL